MRIKWYNVGKAHTWHTARAYRRTRISFDVIPMLAELGETSRHSLPRLSPSTCPRLQAEANKTESGCCVQSHGQKGKREESVFCVQPGLWGGQVAPVLLQLPRPYNRIVRAQAPRPDCLAILLLSLNVVCSYASYIMSLCSSFLICKIAIMIIQCCLTVKSVNIEGLLRMYPAHSKLSL